MLWVSNWRSFFLTANVPHHLTQGALPASLDMAMKVAFLIAFPKPRGPWGQVNAVVT